MDEKAFPSGLQVSPIRVRASWRDRPTLLVLLLFCSTFVFYHISPTSNTATDRKHTPTGTFLQPESARQDGELVSLEAHVMSKCPDATDCLRDMILPTMIKVVDKVNFTLSFIGTPTDNDGVSCMHGPEECLGNILELCAQKMYPDVKTWLGFSMCMAKDYKDIPQRSLVEDCALEHAIDFSKLNECATRDDGAFGMGLLRDSVQRTSRVRQPLDTHHTVSIATVL